MWNKTCLENRVVKDQWGYTCVMCNYESFSCDVNIIDKHMSSAEHMQMLKAIRSKDNRETSAVLQFVEKQCKELVENHITFVLQKKYTSLLECQICKCPMNSLHDAYSHIKGKPHICELTQRRAFSKGIAKSIGWNSVLGNGIAKSTGPNLSIIDFPHLKPIQNHKVNSGKNTVNRLINKKLCNICNSSFDNNISLSCHVMLHILSEFKSSIGIDVIKYDFLKNDSVIKCLICNISIEDLKLEEHLKMKKHSERLEHFIITENSIPHDLLENNIKLDSQTCTNIQNFLDKHITKMICCQKCNITFEENSLNEHINSKKHIGNQHVEVRTSSAKILNNNYLTCFMCQMWFDSLEKLINHYNHSNHKSRMYYLDIINKNPHLQFKKKEIYCILCKTITETCAATQYHIMGKKHKFSLEENDKNSSQLSNQINDIKEPQVTAVTKSHTNNVVTSENNTIKLSKINIIHKSESLASISTDSQHTLNDMLNDLIELNSNRFIQKKLIGPSNSKPSQASTETQSNLNSIHVYKWGIKYIQLCIRPGLNNIYNLDPDQIRLLQLGASLIFSINSKQMCLPCGKQLPPDINFTYEHLQEPNHIKNIKELEANDKEFINYPNQYSDLTLAKQFMVEVNKNRVQCYACNVAINNNSTDISLHTEMSKHIIITRKWSESARQMSNEFTSIFENIWYYAQVFICEICSVKCDFEIDFVKHLSATEHSDNKNKFQAQGVIMKYDFCPACVTYWYGNMESHKLHCEATYHRRFANNGDFAVQKMSPMTIDLLKTVDTKIINLENESNKINLDKPKQRELLKVIEETVCPMYPNSKAYIFGSRLSNLGFPDSDVDIFLDCQSVYNQLSNKAADQKILLNVKNFFENLPDVWIIDEILLQTRVPILKLRHIPTSLKCDISFTSGLSVEKSTLVGDYNNAYRECRLLTLYLKKWLTTCKLAGSECITTFATSWLVIFYLQTKGILPSVHDLINLKNESKMVDGWECGFNRCVPTTHSALNFKDHLKSFFHFYSNYDFRVFVICPYLGISVKKQSFTVPKLLPNEYELYKRRLDNNQSIMFRIDSPMCVQDPVDLSQNITKAVKKLQLRCFKKYCFESYQLINKN